MDNFKVSRQIRPFDSKKSANVHFDCKSTAIQIALLTKAAQDVLNKFPKIPYACALMSAAWVAIIRDNTTISANLVAGCLDLNGQRVFGDDRTMVNPFLGSSPCWKGHCWVSFGEIIGDISLFRTANANSAPKLLKKAVCESFVSASVGDGFLLGETKVLGGNGLKYTPKYIATDDQITEFYYAALDKMGML